MALIYPSLQIPIRLRNLPFNLGKTQRIIIQPLLFLWFDINLFSYKKVIPPSKQSVAWVSSGCVNIFISAAFCGLCFANDLPYIQCLQWWSVLRRSICSSLTHCMSSAAESRLPHQPLSYSNERCIWISLLMRRVLPMQTWQSRFTLSFCIILE